MGKRIADDDRRIMLEAGRGGLSVSLRTLVATCALVQGTRGSGKSYFARVVCEGTIGAGLQTIILDPEGEYCTLRERCDLLIAGPGGDVPCEVRSAKLLARRLADTGISAVVDQSAMSIDDRCDFVAAFLTAFDRLPKSLARPRLFVIDEAHKVCPESGKGRASSKDAVVTLLSQGRKRGDGAMLLTQRLAKLSNDAAAEAGNIFIGRTSPIDLARAQDLLGITAKERDSLRRLKSGTFYGTGPASSCPDVRLFKCRQSATTHPEPGERFKITAPPPKAALKKILKAFEEIPAEPEAAASPVDPRATAQREAEIRREAESAGEARAWKDFRRALAGARAKAAVDLQFVDELLLRVESTAVYCTSQASEGRQPSAAERRPAAASPPASGGTSRLGEGGVRRIMTTLAQHPDGLERTPLALRARLSAKSGTFARYLSTLTSQGYASRKNGRWYPTPEGVGALGTGWEPLPAGEALVDHWRDFVGDGGIRRMLDALVAAGVAGLSRDELAEASALAVSSGTFARYLSKLRSLQVAEGRNPIVIAEALR